MEVTAGEATERVFAPERRSLTLGIVLAVAVFAADGMGVVPTLPKAVRELGGMPLFGWAFSSFMLAWIVGTVAAGQLADARGPRSPMALGVGTFGVGLLLAAVSPSMAPFLVGRALQGMGGGGMVAAAYVAIARGYPDSLRSRMMAILASVWIIPSVVGPSLSGFIAQRTSWRVVFGGIVPFAAVTALLVLRPLRRFDVERPATDPRRVPSALRLALGAALCIAAPSLPSLGRVAAVGSLVVGTVLLLPPLQRLLPPGTFRARPGLPMGMLARALLAFSFFGAEAFVPLCAIELRGATQTQAGLALTTGALGWITASWTQDALERRQGAQGRVARARIGFLLLAVGIAAVASVLCGGLPLLLAPLGWAVAGAGVSLGYNSGSLLCIATATEERQGEVTAQLQLAESLATAAGTGLSGALLALLKQLGVPPQQAYLYVFGPMLAVVLVGAALAGRLAAGKAPVADRDLAVGAAKIAGGGSNP